MGWVKNAKAASMAKAAQDAWAAGDRYFTPLLNFPMSNLGASGAIPDWPPMLDAIEDAGWKLHTWAMTTDSKSRPQAMPLFIRP